MRGTCATRLVFEMFPDSFNGMGKLSMWRGVLGGCLVWGMIASPAVWAMGKKPTPVEKVTLEFPEGFRWCASTAAHQIEGGNIHSDWWNWEYENWAVRSGNAADSWNRVSEDVGLLREIHAGMYRFSVEWAKIEPTQGRFDLSVIAHYRDQVKQLRAAGIEPMITLHHFTFPRWVRQLGGFEWEGLPQAFANYVQLVISQIGPDVEDWITINEPMVHLTLGYVGDRQPPNVRGESRELEAIIPPLRGLLRAHAQAYSVLKRVAREQKRSIRVGIANHLRVFDPKIPINPLDAVGASIFDYAFNWLLPNAIETGRLSWPKEMRGIIGAALPKINIDEVIPGLRGTQDFFGLNYYTRDYVSVDLAKPANTWLLTVEDPNYWEIYASGLHRLLLEAHRRMPRLPIVITENGVSDSGDKRRAHALDQHLYAIHQAMRAGVPITGYCHWSLIDNFEWSLGFEPRFGLFEVDYENDFKRTPRSSALHFGDIARTNQVTVEPFTLEGSQ